MTEVCEWQVVSPDWSQSCVCDCSSSLTAVCPSAQFLKNSAQTRGFSCHFLHRTAGEKYAQGTWTWEAPYMLIPTVNQNVTGQAGCLSHILILVAFSNNNVELSNFISMIIYLHCTDTNEKHPQVHSTIQYIYFKNIFLYKRFIEHWHVHVTNSQSLSPILW